MKFKDIISMVEMMAAGVGVTSSGDVKGVPKPFGMVTRDYPGYEEDRKKKKKRKHIHHRSSMHEGTGDEGGQDDEVKLVSGELAKKVFAGDRPKYKRKKNSFAKPEKNLGKNVVKEDEWEPFEQRTPSMDLELMRKAFQGDRPEYKRKKVNKKRKLKEQFMGPQIFYNDSPYADLEYLVKFWKGGRKPDIEKGEDKNKTKRKLPKREKAKGEYKATQEKIDTETSRWGRLGG